MSPKNTLNVANRAGDGHRLRGCREPTYKADKHKLRHCREKADRKRKRSKKLKWNESEANKSLYICYIEHHPGKRVSYVVCSIKLSDLLSSDSVDSLQLQQVGYKAGDAELPSCGGCGVLGSQIVFAAGLTLPGRFVTRFTDSTWHRDVYVFETDPWCERGPFPFVNRALVLDVLGDHNSNKKIMFAYNQGRRWSLGVYIMFLDENRESITQIVDLELPMLPEEFDYARISYIIHIGGQKACLVAPEMGRPEGQAPKSDEVGSHKTRGVAIPFQFEVDITKIDKDVRNCLSLQFMHTRIFEFYTNASTFPDPEADGCFVL